MITKNHVFQDLETTGKLNICYCRINKKKNHVLTDLNRKCSQTNNSQRLFSLFSFRIMANGIGLCLSLLGLKKQINGLKRVWTQHMQHSSCSKKTIVN